MIAWVVLGWLSATFVCAAALAVAYVVILRRDLRTQRRVADDALRREQRAAQMLGQR